MYQVSFCYSDHNHDIDNVGICEMCGGVEPEGIDVYRPQQDLFDRVNAALHRI